MTNINEAFRAGIDAVVADNGLNRGGFADAIRTILTQRFSNAEATAWIDAIAAAYEAVGIINNPTYNNLRGAIINAADADEAEALFNALGASITTLPETRPAIDAAEIIDLRDERDNIDAAITRCDTLISGEPAGTVGRLVKEVLRNGKDLLREQKRAVRERIEIITGDPDS